MDTAQTAAYGHNKDIDEAPGVFGSYGLVMIKCSSDAIFHSSFPSLCIY